MLSADAGCDGRCLADIAYCAQNANGGYSCHCLPGYAGDGETTCTGSYSPHASIVFKLVRGHLHQASASTLRQLWDDASDIVLIENKGVAPDWGCKPFSSNPFSLQIVPSPI